MDGDFHFLYYRNDILQELNVTPPRDWYEYLAVAKKVTDAKLKTKDNLPIYGSCLPKGEAWMRSDFFETVATSFQQSLGTNQVPKISSVHVYQINTLYHLSSFFRELGLIHRQWIHCS